MATATTDIAWTDRTWNPVRGCSVVSPGCHSCYAMKQAHRFSGPGQPYEGLTKLTARSGPQWTGQIRLVEEALLEPLKWRKPARVFVNSMSDLFHEGVPDAFIDQVFAVMALAPRHTFQVLTKRPERMRDYFAPGKYRDVKVADAAKVLHRQVRPFALPDESIFEARPVAFNLPWMIHAWPLPNVWLGVSVEDQQRADERIPLLLQTPAAVRFISAEPLLGPVDLVMPLRAYCPTCDCYLLGQRMGAPYFGNDPYHGRVDEWCGTTSTHLDWVIVGGESGPGARPMCVSWVRNIVHDCAEAKVPCFVKQLGAKPYEQYDDGGVLSDVRLHDRKGGDPAEWESYLRVREFPQGGA